MTNKIFNGMEAKDFLEKVIERENKFKNADYKALSFEERRNVEKENAFWQNVLYTVTEHYSNRKILNQD